MKKWIWLGLSVVLVIAGIVIYVVTSQSGIDAVTSASIRIISPGEKNIKQTRTSYQEDASAWIDISDILFKKEWTEYGGPRILIEYDLNEEDISPETPAYIFFRYRPDDGEPWQLIPAEFLRGNGYGIVNKPGHKTFYLWGAYESVFDNFVKAEFRIRGIKMARVPDGEFVMRSLPGAGKDDTETHERVTDLSTFYMAKYETTVRMYTDYLNEVAPEEIGWNRMMEEDSICGIIRNKAFLRKPRFQALPGREHYPVTQVSWYDARGFLEWCGLRLPTEAEFEKAFRGGKYLDGTDSKRNPNPLPERNYPWGDAMPDEDGTFRCNAYGEEDGYPYTAPVGSYEEYNSPYDIADLAGNVEEWTLDWYTTSYHVGLDGYRMTRGGSWMEFSLVVDAISGATKAPILESGLVGFRGVYSPDDNPVIAAAK